MVATNPNLTSSDLIRTLYEIVGLEQGDAMELVTIESSEQEVDYDVAQVNTGGRISMPALFDSMRELPTTLDNALPSNPFLHKWLKSRVSKDETQAGKVRFGVKGRGRGGSKGHTKRVAGRYLRNKEVEVEDLSLDDLGEIEVTSEAFEELSLINHVVEVAGSEEGCNATELQVMLVPSFKKHSLHNEKSIHISVRLHEMTAIALIDCGATNNFINLGFMKKRGMQPNLLEQSRIYRLGKGTTEVTHSYKSSFEVGETKLPVEFYVMNGKSSQGIMLRCTFLAENDATINFKTRKLRLGGMKVHCLSSQLKDELEDSDGNRGMKGVKDLHYKWGLRCVEQCKLLPRKSCIIGLQGCAQEWIRKQVEGRS